MEMFFQINVEWNSKKLKNGSCCKQQEIKKTGKRIL